jgi:hypothetical protein
MDGKEYAPKRTREEMEADWYWFTALKDLDGMSRRGVSDHVGIPYATVVLTLDTKRPDDEDRSVTFCKMWVRRLAGEGWKEIAHSLGLKLRAVDWLNSDFGRPRLESIIDDDSFVTWVREHESLRLITGEEVTQKTLQEMLGVSQARVSQKFADWKEAWEMNEERLARQSKMDLTLPEKGERISNNESDADGLSLKVSFNRAQRPDDSTDSSPIGFVKQLERALEVVNPQNPTTVLMTGPAEECQEIWRNGDMAFVNVITTFPRTCIDVDTRPHVLEQLKAYKAVLDRGIPRLEKQIQADIAAMEDGDEEVSE